MILETILWTLIMPGVPPRAQPYPLATGLTNAQCIQRKNDYRPPIASGSYKQRRKQPLPYCKPEL